jgi:P-type Ca2+ transporter type 2C
MLQEGMGSGLEGLNASEAVERRAHHGANKVRVRKRYPVLEVLKEVVTEPLFLLLVITAGVYFALGEQQEGVIMLLALGFVSGISLYQEQRSRKAVDALQWRTIPSATVIRDSRRQDIHPEEVVVDDLVLISYGQIIPADGELLEAHDLMVDESLLTGESVPLRKLPADGDAALFQGSPVVSGAGLMRVLAVGKATRLGRIQTDMQEIQTPPTPLQLQIRTFIRGMVLVGAGAFLLVWVLASLKSGHWMQGLLQGLTLAMSILPEEIPVAFSTFMALGAWHLYRRNVIARSPYTVETLGGATVICADKTGTLTENRMHLEAVYEYDGDRIHRGMKDGGLPSETLTYAMWASEPEPFDPMEKALHAAYGSGAPEDLRPLHAMVHEYPLDGQPPIMTHVFQAGQDAPLIAVKGGPEGVLRQCHLDESERDRVLEIAGQLADEGLRVLGVGKTELPLDALPEKQEDLRFSFLGLVAFADPPKANIREVLAGFKQAGIGIKMITGDHAGTARAIARQSGLAAEGSLLTGEEVLAMPDEELRQKVGDTHLYARMFPDAKLKVIEALKANGEVVAMTGDGVNDGPALKAAHIGVAMGKRGSELARRAADLVLLDDDLDRMRDAVALGRRIYENLKKAIRYIISIHIPIILIVALPLLLGWTFTDIFSPIHVIFLELIMGPTCSIVFENEPIEPGSMQRPPRKTRHSFFSWPELRLSIVQGLAITLACLSAGWVALDQGQGETYTRTLIYAILICANILLTLVNRSFLHSLWRTLGYRNILIPIMIGASVILLLVTVYFPPARELFGFEALAWADWALILPISAAAVLWLEIWKWRQRGLASAPLSGG